MFLGTTVEHARCTVAGKEATKPTKSKSRNNADKTSKEADKGKSVSSAGQPQQRALKE